MENFEEYIKNCDFLTDEHKMVILWQYLDEYKKRNIIETIEIYIKNLNFQKSILENIELSWIKTISSLTKKVCEKEKLEENEKNLEIKLNNI